MGRLVLPAAAGGDRPGRRMPQLRHFRALALLCPVLQAVQYHSTRVLSMLTLVLAVPDPTGLEEAWLPRFP